MPHTRKKFFYPKPSSFSNKLFFDVDSTLIIIQRESEKTIWKADFKTIFLQRVRFWIKKLTTRQILKKKNFLKAWFRRENIFKKHDFEEKDIFKKQDFEWKGFCKKDDFELKILQRVRFWRKVFF